MKILENNYKIFVICGILKCVPFTFKKSNDKMYSVLPVKIHNGLWANYNVAGHGCVAVGEHEERHR